jgi:diguanylate cyclase (GGDEF)-like protein
MRDRVTLPHRIDRGHPASRSDRLMVRGGAAAWLLVAAVLLAPDAAESAAVAGARWAAVAALATLGVAALGLPLERLPRSVHLIGAWVAIAASPLAGLAHPGTAQDAALLMAMPLIWLAVRHGWLALLAGCGLAVLGVPVAVLLPPGGAAGPLAYAAAILVAVLLKLLSRRGGEAAEFSTVAFTDFLTNCPNRRAWERDLPGRLAQARRLDRPLVVAVLDLDRFGAYNEDWGHAAGDRLLTDVATELRFVLRTGPEAEGLTYIARLGADEFALVIEGLGTAAASSLVRGLEARLPTECTVTVGMAFWDEREGADELLGRALRALGAAGRTGGEARVVVDEGSGSRAHSWLEAVPALVARQEITSVYQPIRELAGGRLVGFEALARPSGSPSDLEVDGMFAAARRLGVSRELESLCQVAALSGADRLLIPGCSLFINVSVAALTEVGLQALLRDLSAARVAPEQVVLEVNEQITRVGRFTEACARFRAAGFRFAMDDVGEGLSTIEAIAVVRPEVIKIAKGLVSTAGDPGSAAMIRGLVETARSLGGEIIAEGIETREHAERMLALGAVLGQGWGLGTPAPLSAALAIARAEVAVDAPGRAAEPRSHRGRTSHTQAG